MDWGHKQADQLQLESYIDATENGAALYQACGYAKADRIDLEILESPRSRRGRELQEELLPFSFWPVWRPVMGDYQREDAALPWKHLS